MREFNRHHKYIFIFITFNFGHFLNNFYRTLLLNMYNILVEILFNHPLPISVNYFDEFCKVVVYGN